ncbi:MAG: amidase [Halobacteriota archaeon]
MSSYVADARLGEIASSLRSGRSTPSATLDRLEERIDRIDAEVRALLPEEHRFDRLEREAAALEARYRDPGSRPPLYGVPIGVKDIFHVDGQQTIAGSSLPADELTGGESAAVTALRAAGALVLGKTVTTEFAYFAPGPTRNPHNLEHTPGGSSSGSAAAVAAGLCPLALGSQTIGSVNRPAAFCGVVGVKPSYDRIPIDGVLPVAPSVDHVGFFTQDVHGAIRAANVLYDDWRSGERPTEDPTIAAVDGPYLQQASQTGRTHFDRHVNALETAGFEVERLTVVPEIESVNDRHTDLVAAETALSHAARFPRYADRYADETAALIEQGRDVDVGSLCDARAGRLALRNAVHDRMDEYGIDLVISPAAPGPAPAGLETTGDPIMNLPWTHAGVPTVTVPASKTGAGLPIGLQCSARFGADESLLRWCGSIADALTSGAA